tara:strand:+ start:448 stop:756 length:309 start_codon:yes stop_codon:yes gene_type:complete
MKKPIKSEITMKFWVTIPDQSIAKAVKCVFLDSLVASNYSSLACEGAHVDTTRGLITIQSPSTDIDADDAEFIYHVAQDWENAIDEVNEDINRLKRLGVAFK